jgi:hypothetical protein
MENSGVVEFGDDVGNELECPSAQAIGDKDEAIACGDAGSLCCIEESAIPDACPVLFPNHGWLLLLLPERMCNLRHDSFLYFLLSSKGSGFRILPL